MRHTTIRRMLYDYALDELPSARRATVEEHLQTCRSCAADVQRLTEALGLLKISPKLPSDDLSTAYWEQFASTVDHKIDGSRNQFAAFSFLENMGSFLLLRPAGTAAAMGTLVVATIAFLLFPRQVPPRESVVNEAPSVQAVPAAAKDVRMSDYLRRSKALLVGLSNMNTVDEGPVDLSVERDASRKLVREARYLKQQPLDPRSSRLINDLDKILIEVANMKANVDRPDVEFIRGGIHQENLLFKIRMAENFYRTARFSQSGGSAEDNDRQQLK